MHRQLSVLTAFADGLARIIHTGRTAAVDYGYGHGMNTYSAFDGDIVRPLGFVALHAAYAEREIGKLLQLLCETADLPPTWFRRPVGWKLRRVSQRLSGVHAEAIPDLLDAVRDAQNLFGQRNDLIHGLLFSGGTLIPLDPSAPHRLVTPDEVAALGQALFNCKERLDVYRQKQLIPALAKAQSGS